MAFFTIDRPELAGWFSIVMNPELFSMRAGLAHSRALEDNLQVQDHTHQTVAGEMGSSCHSGAGVGLLGHELPGSLEGCLQAPRPIPETRGFRT